MKYRKKPVVIEAMKYEKENIHGVMNWIEEFVNQNSEVLRYDPFTNEYMVKTLEGELQVLEGDYIIRGVKGEFYPCRSDIFEQTYEPVKEDENND